MIALQVYEGAKMVPSASRKTKRIERRPNKIASLKALRSGAALKKFVPFLLIVILALYVFRDCLSVVRMENAIYGLSALAFMLCIFIPKQGKKMPLGIALYVFVGVFSLIISYCILNNHSLLVATLGFVASYANLFIWLLFFSRLKQEEKTIFFERYLNAVIILGVLTALLGIYQTFFDRSIFGLATNSLYSSEEAMSSGRYVPRATALLGSAQNYGLFVGIAFCASLFFGRKKGFLRNIGIITLMLGVIVSGSRSASICLIISAGFFFCYSLTRKRVPQGFLIAFFACAAIVLVCFTLVGAPDLLDDRAAQRLFDFSMSETFKVYREVSEGLTGFSMLLGNGLGYGSWTVAQIIGEYTYSEAFNAIYASTESYFLQTWLQMGLPGLVALALIELSALRKAYAQGNVGLLALLTCVFVNQVFTPSFASLAVSYAVWPVLLYALVSTPAYISETGSLSKRNASGISFTDSDRSVGGKS